MIFELFTRGDSQWWLFAGLKISIEMLSGENFPFKKILLLILEKIFRTLCLKFLPLEANVLYISTHEKHLPSVCADELQEFDHNILYNKKIVL